MSDRPIQVGDLVQVVRGASCCGTLLGHEGRIFLVKLFTTIHGRCSKCGDGKSTINALGEGHSVGYEITRLKRIPPLDELEGVRTDEPIREPA